MATKRRRRARREARFSPQDVILGLVVFLIIGFFLLDFLHKGKESAGKKVKEEVGEEISIEQEAGIETEAPLAEDKEMAIAEAEEETEEDIETEKEKQEEEAEAEIEAEAEEEIENKIPPDKVKKEEPAEEVKEEASLPLPPRVAIIIDDLGYSLKAAKPLFDIEYPLTLSILPGLRYSLLLAERMSRSPFDETMLHLPLEPESEAPLEQGTIMVAMSKKEVRGWMEKHLQPLLPYIKGVNGHMGSKATADEKLMRIVLEEVKKRNLYFVDSYTTDKSVALEVAKSLGIKTVSRQVFLDLGRKRNNADYIRGQMEELADLARKHGKAVAIGHPKPLTLKILQEMMPKLAREGIQFVTVSEVVE